MIRFFKRLGAVIGVLVVLVFALIGLLTVTRGTPVRRVLAVGDDKLPGVRVTASASATAKTGVEMEALTAAAVALLTISDMTKAMGKEMVMGEISGRTGEVAVQGPEFLA